MTIVYEKCFKHLFLFSKKRYAGMKYLENPNEGELSYSGIILIRNDVSKVTKHFFWKVLNLAIVMQK